MTDAAEEWAATRARRAPGLLHVFNAAGVLGLADAHTARVVSGLVREDRDEVQLALALAVRAVRMGSVCLDLRTVHDTVFDEAEETLNTSTLPWPEASSWLDMCRTSPLVNDGADLPSGLPLRLVSGLLYLERYWQQQEVVRSELQSRWGAEALSVDRERLAAALSRLFPGFEARALDQGLPGERSPIPLDPSPIPSTNSTHELSKGEPDLQKLAAAVSALSSLTVIAGGPGTGKTTAVARILALLRDQPGPPLRIALAAPTGKAAARLAEAVRTAAAELTEADRHRLGTVSASTVHRLLGWQPNNQGRFKHHAGNHLPFDVIVVDEMSMVSLTLMARLLEAVRPSARLVLVGDPHQLSSVEAGAVLADIVGAEASSRSWLAEPLRRLGLGAADSSPTETVVQLRHNFRFGQEIADLAEAIRCGDADTTLSLLQQQSDTVVFCPVDLASAHEHDFALVSRVVQETGISTWRAAHAGDPTRALAALEAHRLLCAHRRGPYGVSRWSLAAEQWLHQAIPGYGTEGEWYVGRPLLVTANNYDLDLFNGDTGVVVSTPNGVRAAFARGADPRLVAPVRLDDVQSVHAMTVHRSQGSQFDCVSFLVPPVNSPLLTRELLYTAVTRARHRVQILGTPEAIQRAVRRPANRASGLRSRLAHRRMSA